MIISWPMRWKFNFQGALFMLFVLRNSVKKVKLSVLAYIFAGLCLFVLKTLTFGHSGGIVTVKKAASPITIGGI